MLQVIIFIYSYPIQRQLASVMMQRPWAGFEFKDQPFGSDLILLVYLLANRASTDLIL